MPRNLEQMGVEAVIKGIVNYLRGMDQMGKETKKTQSIIGKVGGIAKGAIGGIVKIGAVAGAAAIGGIAALSAGLLKLASDAAPIAGIKSAFDDLTASMEGGSKAVLAALKEQSAGMITNTDLMKSYNLAALLIGESFTEQLPDAMGFVGKVALATGEDMGFLMDSLVRGIGRLSPMILDNLGITVNLTEAYEAWSKETGIAVSEMSKADQQAALMAQTMAALESKTADMPDVTGSAKQSFAAFGVEMQNLKDDIGLAVLPAVSEMMGSFTEIGQKIFPDIVDFVKMNLVPILEDVSAVIRAIAEAGFDSAEMWETLANLLGEDVAKSLEDVWDWMEVKIPEAFETVKNFWNSSLKPTLMEIVDFFTNIGDIGKEEFFDAGLGVTSKGPRAGFDEIFRNLLGDTKTFLEEELPKLWIAFGEWLLDFLGLPSRQETIDAWQGVMDNLETIVETTVMKIKEFFDGMVRGALKAVEDIQTIMRAIQGDPAAILDIIGGGLGPPPPIQTQPRGEGDIPAPTGADPIMLPPIAPLSTTGDNFNLTINTSAPIEPIKEDFRMMRTMRGRRS
jgi:hypothetical protein